LRRALGPATSGVCPFTLCFAPDEGCCVGGTTTCMPPASCTGSVIECDLNTSQPCTMGLQECCPGVGSSAFCTHIIGGG
jgi:hypothetical protein